MNQAEPARKRTGLLGAIGPAIITASVVLGPGSILTSSQTGYQFGYSMAWVLALAVLMMIIMTALSARLGVLLEGTPCHELARREGRWAAILVGVSLFLVAACFQFGNNTGVIAAVEPFLPKETRKGWLVGSIVALNLLVILALFGLKKLYVPVERLMKFLVALMVIAFAGNLILARPDLRQLGAGFIPRLPEGAPSSLFPRMIEPEPAGGLSAQKPEIVDPLLPVVGLFATTFSLGGAFYQAYLVREKGWTRAHLRRGLVDSIVGICVLGLITMMIMVTAAAVLHGRADVGKLQTAADVARQLEPLFGRVATVLFCVGIFAGAFSSFLVNAMIGGTILSDGLGLGGKIDGLWPKAFTVLVLLVGMVVAAVVLGTQQKAVPVIIFAQAVTVIAVPALAAAMLYLATRPDMTGARRVPLWLKAGGAVALVIVVVLAVRTAARVYFSVHLSLM